MNRRSAWARAWAELRSAIWPSVAFLLMTATSMALFFGLIIASEGYNPNDAWIMGAIGVVTFGGIAVGQVLALLRLRTWVVAVLTMMFWAAGVAVASTGLPIPDPVGSALAVVVVLGPFFALAGLWSLQANMGLLASWAPLVFVSGSIIVVSETYTGSVAQWHAGSKWAIWDLFSAPILLFGVGFLVLYLAARERHRLVLWGLAPGGPDLPKVEARAPTRNSGMGCGSAAAGAILAVLLTIGAALTAPYLWRTASDEDPGEPAEAPQGIDQQVETPPPPQGCGSPPTEEEQGGPGTPTPAEPPNPEQQVQQAVEQAGLSLMTLILALFLALAGLLVFVPPLRRALLLRHLRKPLWPLPPTRQVMQAWRVVEIALADRGIHRRPGDSAQALALRAVSELPPDIDTDALLRCAALTDRVVYGLGVDGPDPDEARRTAEMAYQVIWELLGEDRRVAAVYRLL